MRVGGPAPRMVVAETPDELVDAVREVDDADEPLLVLGGGSNLVVADAGFAGHGREDRDPRASWSTPRPVRRRDRPRRRGRGLGRFVAVAVAEGGRAWRRCPASRALREQPRCRTSGLRAGGRADHRPGAGLGPRARSGCATMTSPTAGSPTATRSSRRTDRYVVLDVTFQLDPGPISQPVALCRPRHGARRRGGGAGAARARRAKRCWPSDDGAGWCSTPRTTTRGAAGRSSPTRSCRREFEALEARVAGRLGADGRPRRGSRTPTATSRPAPHG